MDMNCDCMHESVVHDLMTLVAVANLEAAAVDDSVIASADNNIHFDCDCHPNCPQKRNSFALKSIEIIEMCCKNNGFDTYSCFPLICRHVSIVCVAVA